MYFGAQHCPYCFQPTNPMTQLKDFGPNPFVVNIHEATMANQNYRLAFWTGKNLQMTLMALPPGGDIGLEVHPHTDQFIRLEQGYGVVQMGNRRDNLPFRQFVGPDSAIFVPAGTWHNLVNTGNMPLKLYTIYAPPNHPYGTVEKTKADAEKET